MAIMDRASVMYDNCVEVIWHLALPGGPSLHREGEGGLHFDTLLYFIEHATKRGEALKV